MAAEQTETEVAVLGLEMDGFWSAPALAPHAAQPPHYPTPTPLVCSILESVIPPSEVPAVREAVVSSIEARVDHPNPAGNTTFINVCPPHCTPWFADPRVLGVLERCFGPVPHTRIGGTSCVIHEPNPSPAERAALGPTGKGGLHSDWPGRLYQAPMWSSDRGPPPPGFDKLLSPGPMSIMTDVQAFFLLTDFTEANGGT